MAAAAARDPVVVGTAAMDAWESEDHTWLLCLTSMRPDVYLVGVCLLVALVKVGVYCQSWCLLIPC
jgi:hypothetical protein